MDTANAVIQSDSLPTQSQKQFESTAWQIVFLCELGGFRCELYTAKQVRTWTAVLARRYNVDPARLNVWPVRRLLVGAR